MNTNLEVAIELLLDSDLGLDGVGNKTLLVRHVMHLFEFLLGRLFVTGELQFGMQFHPRDRQSAVFIFLHVTDSVIGVVIQQKFLLTSYGEESEHVTGGERSDKRFLWINIFWITEIDGGGGGGHFVAAVELPSVIAIVGLILEVGRGALPRERHFMFGHPSV